LFRWAWSCSSGRGLVPVAVARVIEGAAWVVCSGGLGGSDIFASLMTLGFVDAVCGLVCERV